MSQWLPDSIGASLNIREPERVERANPAAAFLQFLLGGCLFAAGAFLLAGQVMVHSSLGAPGRGAFGLGRGGWGAGWWAGWGAMPGMGLLMIPFGFGVLLLVAGAYRRWANLLLWGSLAAFFVGVMNSLRLSFMPATLWQLLMWVAMMAAGGGLMLRGVHAFDEVKPASTSSPTPSSSPQDLDREMEELKKRVLQR